MGENIETKDGEQYPLLKMDSGGGDNINRTPQLPPSVITSGCHITRTPKQSWMDRWPEFFSACWITFILIGISFLAFYTLGMNAYRRQPIIIKCNASKQANTVHYHHIVPRGSYVPFILYSDYISSVANQYPSLSINVVFLMDDSTQNAIHGSRHTRLFNKLIQPSINLLDSIFDQNNKKEIRNIQKKYLNVNITVMPLSKYMALTPHRYKWKTIPAYYLNFYIRLFTVWQYGGIAMDLTTFNNIFNINQYPDRRISAILKQHNDGLENEKYVNALKKINQEDQNEIFTMFFLLIHHVLNETCSFFNRTLWYNNEVNPDSTLNNPLFLSQRSKHDSHDMYAKGESDLYGRIIQNIQENKGSKTPVKSMFNASDYLNNLSSSNHSKNFTRSLEVTDFKNESEIMNGTFNIVNSVSDNVTKQPIIIGFDNIFNYSSVQGEISPNIFFYDVSILTDNIPFLSEPINFVKPINQGEFQEGGMPENINLVDHPPINLPILSISTDGTFIAAPSRHHPMLAYLISFASQKVSPIFAINRAMMTQCSGIMKNEMHCDNIYVL
ncbi:uncharacterized protein [Battus philenor]|uniref:uncharacterized protein n=1 Tax=Battus philenor TaxID=42288 RepID=UPI0035D09FAC